MTTSIETPGSTGAPESPLNEAWRAARAQEQQHAMPTGSVTVSCPAPLGVGGLGRHLGEIVGALEATGVVPRSISESSGSTGSADGLRERATNIALAPLARLSPSLRMWSASVGFDRRAARALGPGEHLIAFNGTAAAQFRAARSGGFDSLRLVAANSHYRHVRRQHERAHRQYPIEGQWSTRLLERNLREYREADRIYYASGYIRESFLEQGFPEDQLLHFPLTPDVRFAPAARPSESSTFDVVYVGSLTVHKGVPLLIDAVRALPHALELRLILIGGWGTRGMRSFIQRACAEDARISVRHGDPLPYLREARLSVHAAYEDGFAYAPAEALACGVPVIVSEDTGMKELVQHGRNGLILATGDLSALTQAIDAAYRSEAIGG
jgi:glycosyltransferase involved in cell wall biosynthesis